MTAIPVPVTVTTNPAEAAYPLGEHERAVRDRFVDEYIKDYDPLNAAIRIGFSRAYAGQYSKLFMSESYTLGRIKEMEVAPNNEMEKEAGRRFVIATLRREANDMRSTGSARVAAAAQLSKILGIEAPVKVENDIKLGPTAEDLKHLSTQELEQLKKMIYGKSGSATLVSNGN